MDPTTDASAPGNPASAPGRPRPAWPRVAAIAALAALPLILAFMAYYPGQLAGAAFPRLHGDAALYAYQLSRAAECGGRWWRIADDPRLGHPYPTEFAKHPGLFEGVE